MELYEKYVNGENQIVFLLPAAKFCNVNILLSIIGITISYLELIALNRSRMAVPGYAANVEFQ